ncbi:DUF1846 domain-containing protein [Thermoproteota archaeon]
MHRQGFDTDQYLNEQKKSILERVSKFGKLYLEFGGKLCYDLHASRVLPGYRPSAKIELLKQLGDIEIIYCVNAKYIDSGKVRRDFGLTHDNQTLKDIGDINNFGLKVNTVVITFYDNQGSVDIFKKKLENFGINVYLHKAIAGYPHDMRKVIEGYEKQPYVETSKRLVLVTGVGGNSGKMATCLSQIYQERQKGIKTGFAKFETFPIWNLDLNHPINIAYEAATADLKDVNVMDTFHKNAYDITSVNYNRDMENFAILQHLIERITQEKSAFGYKSPTDMGVNMAATGIIDDEVCREAAKQEIVRRHFNYKRSKIEGVETQDTIEKMEELMEKAGVKPEDRKVVLTAREASEKAKSNKGFNNIYCGAAIQLKDQKMVYGKNSSLLHAESAAVLNAIKELAGIPDTIDLISPDVIKSITETKTILLNRKTPNLNVDETIIALAISSTTNPTAKLALDHLSNLQSCEMHVTHLPKKGDEAGLMRLNMNITTDGKLALSPYFQ